MAVRRATDADFDAMWRIFRAVTATGDALPFAEGFDRDTFRLHWFGSQPAYVALADDAIVGMYKMGANHPDLGSHIASATYVVSPAV